MWAARDAGSRRTIGLRRFLVEGLATRLADPGDLEAFVLIALEGGPLG